MSGYCLQEEPQRVPTIGELSKEKLIKRNFHTTIFCTPASTVVVIVNQNLAENEIEGKFFNLNLLSIILIINGDKFNHFFFFIEHVNWYVNHQSECVSIEQEHI